jgi:hypothetical protein
VVVLAVADWTGIRSKMVQDPAQSLLKFEEPRQRIKG